MYYPRLLEKELVRWSKKDYIIVIKGPRQSGKTTLMRHIQSIVGGTYIDLTDEENSELLTTDPAYFSTLPQPLFFDEIQYARNSGRQLKLLYDRFRLKMFVSGSGAFEVKENIGRYLVGRAIYFTLLPLSFEEFLLWRDRSAYALYKSTNTRLWNFVLGKAKKLDIPYSKRIKRLYDEYVKWGGYPSVVLEENKKRLLQSILEVQIEKDMFEFFDIRDKYKFRDVMRMLSHNIGSPLSINMLKISYETAWNYLSILNMEYVVELLPPFYKNLASEIRKRKKLYFYDLGIARFLSNDRINIGQETENFVFLQLMHRFGLHNLRYWSIKGRGEVDFVLTQHNIPVEVKSSAKTSRALQTFMHHYNAPKGIVVCDEFDVKDKKIIHVPVYYV